MNDIFTPRQPTSLKDVQHTLWINDVRVLLPSLKLAPDVMAPAWLLQRQLGSNGGVIPDVLAIRKPREGDRGFLLAIEIDLGAERLKSVFLPKLARLRLAAAEWAASAPAAILVLTRGRGRVGALQTAVDPNDTVPILVRELPHDAGRPGLRALRAVIGGATSN